jgi:hypothetical protein
MLKIKYATKSKEVLSLDLKIKNAIDRNVTKLREADKPSIPSEKLSEFITPRIQKTVNKIAK